MSRSCIAVNLMIFRAFAGVPRSGLQPLSLSVLKPDINIMRPKANGFQKYLRRIINSKKRAREILNVCQSDDDFSKAALAVVWNELFDLMMNGDGDEVDIARISGIVQKLYGSTNQRKSLELKAEEYERREEERQEKKKNLQDSLKRASGSGKGLSADALLQIEEQLNLL